MSKTNALRRLKKALDNKYETQQASPTAGAVGDGKLFIGGQLYDGALSGVSQVVNTGRPAAAQYAAKAGGQVIVRSSGGSGTTTGGSSTDVTALSLLTVVAESALTNDRYLDVSSALTKTDGGAGAALTIGMATPPTLSVSSTNNASTGSHAITSSSSPGAAASLLASSAAGLLTLPNFTATTAMRTPLIDTSSGNLQLTPAADVYITKNVGIGVATAESPLHVESTSAAVTDFLLLEGNRNSANTEVGILFKDRTAVSGGQQVARIYTARVGSTGDFDLVFHAGKQANAGLSDELVRLKGGAGRVGILQASPAYTLDVTGDARVTTSVTTPLLTTATNTDLVINPAGTGAVQFPNAQTIRTSTFDGWTVPYTTGFQINEFAPVPGGSASVLTIGRIQADELDVRVFVANETRVDRGDEFWTKSFGIVAESFTTPSSIGGTVSVKFEDSPALAGAIFANNDWVLIRRLEISTGLSLYNIWGQVATYVNNSDGTQNWTFTLRGGPTSKLVDRGSLGIDFGQVGAGLIHLSVVDASGSPYIKLRKWVSGSDPMTITGPNFKTYVQIGNLGSISNSYYTPSGFGWYVQPSTSDARFIVADDNGLQIRGADIKLYNGSDQTVNLSYTGTDVWIGPSSSDKRVTWNGSLLSVKGAVEITAPSNFSGSGYLQIGSGTKDSNLNGFNMDSSEFVGQASGVDQVIMGTDGKITAGAGAVWLDAAGVNFNVQAAGATPSYLRFASGATLRGGIGFIYTAGPTPDATDGMVFYNAQSTKFRFTGATTTEFSSTVNVTGSVTATVGMSVGGTAVSLDGHTHSYLPLSGGTLTGTLTSRTVAPSANNTYDIGSSSNYFNNGYIRNLHTDTIVGTPSYAHSHAASDITSGTLDFARIPTNWTSSLVLDADSASTYNYVRWLTQTTTGKAWDLVGRAHDYATTAQQNDLLLTYYDGSTIYTAFHADSATRVIDFGQTPTVGGTAVVLTSRTVTAGAAMTGGGALSGDITISHADTSTQASVDNSGTTFIQDVTLDTYGHVTALTSTDVSSVLTGYVKTDGTTAGATSQAQAFNLGVVAIAADVSTAALTLRSARTGLVATNIVGGIDFQSNDTNLTAPGTVTARILALASATHSAGQLATDLVFYTTTGATLAEAVRVAGGGAVTLASTLSVAGAVTGSSTAAFSGTVITPTVSTASGNLTLTSTGGTVAVTGALTGSSTATFATSVSAPILVTASGTLTIAPANSTTSVTGALSLTGTLSGGSWGITSGGAATLVTAAASTSVTTPTVTTASGNLTLTSTGGTVAVTGAATVSGTLSSTSWNITSAGTATLPTITNAGALTLSPTGNITLTPGGNVTLVNTATLGSNDYASRVTGWRVDGAGGADFRTLYADEMHAKTFIADLEQALAGLQIIAKSVAVIDSDFVVPYAGGAQTLPVRDLPSAPNMAAFQANDIVAVRSFSRASGALTIGYAWGAVTSYTDGAGTQSWLFTRSGTTTYNTITARGTATSSTSSGATSRSVTKPTGVVQGDVMVAVVTYDGAVDVVTASGWTELGSASGTDINAHILYRVAGGSEGASYTFSVVNSHAIGAAISAYNNVDTTTPIDDYSIQANAAGTSMPAPAAWATSTAGRLVFLGGITNNSSATPPSGSTELIDAGSTGIRVYVADEVLTTSGNHTKTATIAASHASVAASVILRPTYVSMTSAAGAITPGTVIAAESLALDFGVSGNGFHEVNAVDGTYGANAPYSQVVTWTTHPATGQTVRTRTGNLYGLFAQANEYGFYAGDGTATSNSYVRLSSYITTFNNIPLSIYDSGTKRVEFIPTAGMSLRADTSTSTASQQINWFRDLDSKSATAAGTVDCYTSGTNNKMRLWAWSSGGASVELFAFGGTGSSQPTLRLTDVSGTASKAEIFASTIDLKYDTGPTVVTVTGSVSVVPTAGTSGITLTTPTNQTVGAITIGAADCGSSYGPHVVINRNSNVSTPAAGWLQMVARSGTAVAVWIDNTGTMRLNTGANPTNANDTSGTVIGTQTSYAALKKDIMPWDGSGALDAVLSLPLHSYRFNADESARQYHGIVINDSDRGAWFAENDADNQTPVLNERNLFGYLIAAIKAQQKRIEYLEAQLC